MANNLGSMGDAADLDAMIDWLERTRPKKDDRPFLQLPLPQPPLEEIPTDKPDLPVEHRGVITFEF
jgi:hypothetical protein